MTPQGVGNDLQVCLGLWEASPFLTQPHKTALPSDWAQTFPGRHQTTASARVPAETLGSEMSAASLHEARISFFQPGYALTRWRNQLVQEPAHAPQPTAVTTKPL